MNDAINALLAIVAIVESDPDQAEDVLAIVSLLMDGGRPEEGCLNHIPDSWGCCENCGCMVF